VEEPVVHKRKRTAADVVSKEVPDVGTVMGQEVLNAAGVDMGQEMRKLPEFDERVQWSSKW
jgi:hypothetical protein